MLATDLDLLVKATGWPAVSVLSPAARTEWPALLGEVEERLGSLVDPACAGQLLDALEQAGADLDAGEWPAIGVFANPEFVHAVALPQPVIPRAVIDSTFATRDLVAGLTRTPRYLVLTVDGDGARLWAGLGRRLVPALRPASFPVAFPAPPNASERRQRQERSRVRDAHVDRCHRLLDDALRQALPPTERRPVFLVGQERRVHRLATTSQHADRFAAIVPGDPTSTPDLLVEMIAAHLDDELAARAAAAVDTVGAAIGANRFAAGLAEVWTLAREGRVALLVVEDDYHQPATVDADNGMLHLAEQDVAGGIDDAVDEVIEAVLACGGQVEIVPSGALTEWERVAASLRH